MWQQLVTRTRTRPPWARAAAWAFALALVLKAFMPMLATASASAQGKQVVEVCTAYGVSLVAIDTHDAPQPDPATTGDPAGHGAAHCALTLLPMLALLDGVLPILAAPATAPPPAATPAPQPLPRDASARWVAGLKHAPPTEA